MANRLPMPPPGFEDLPIEDQIDSVQGLWDHIAVSAGNVPLHEWQRQILEERLADYRANPDEGRTWDEVLADVRAQLRST